MIARASSGSSSSINSVEPLISANSAVTVLRSPSIASEVCHSGAMRTPLVASDDDVLPPFAATSLPSTLPQSPQNFFSGGFSAPHCPHRFASGAPQSPQNRLATGLSTPHFAHSIAVYPASSSSSALASLRSAVSKPSLNQFEISARILPASTPWPCLSTRRP